MTNRSCNAGCVELFRFVRFARRSGTPANMFRQNNKHQAWKPSPGASRHVPPAFNMEASSHDSQPR